MFQIQKEGFGICPNVRAHEKDKFGGIRCSIRTKSFSERWFPLAAVCFCGIVPRGVPKAMAQKEHSSYLEKNTCRKPLPIFLGQTYTNNCFCFEWIWMKMYCFRGEQRLKLPCFAMSGSSVIMCTTIVPISVQPVYSWIDFDSTHRDNISTLPLLNDQQRHFKSSFVTLCLKDENGDLTSFSQQTIADVLGVHQTLVSHHKRKIANFDLSTVASAPKRAKRSTAFEVQHADLVDFIEGFWVNQQLFVFHLFHCLV